IVLVTALALGLVPAWRATRANVRGALASGQRTQTGGTSSQRVRAALAVSQVALTLVLLIGAGLLGRSFMRVLSVDPGFDAQNALVMDVWVPQADGETAETEVRIFHERLLEQIRALPGVDAAGGVNALPLSDEGRSNGTFIILNSVDELLGGSTFEELAAEPALLERLGRLFDNPERTGNAEFRAASDGYFRTMGIPLIRGRLFEERDGPDAPHVAVISQSLAETRWPDEDPIGKLIEYGNMDGDLRPFTIVGIVGDVREASLEAEPRPTFYAYSRQRPRVTFRYHVVMRGSADPTTLASSARRIVRELNPEVPIRFRSLEQVRSASLSDRRFTLFLLIGFGATALLVATMGIYGVISYLAAQRTKEIGIRLALGARSRNVLGLMVRQGLVLALAGLAIGVAAAFATSRLLASLLYGVGATDVATFLAVPLILLAVALLASYVPARRATKVDPMIALRTE
ncbi:MAG: FtsX-like permease family protein, partial [Longimicrobiales bacterium]